MFLINLLCLLCLQIVAEDPEILQYSNLDLESIKTPVNVDMMEQLLIESEYDKEET